MRAPRPGGRARAALAAVIALVALSAGCGRVSADEPAARAARAASSTTAGRSAAVTSTTRAGQVTGGTAATRPAPGNAAPTTVAALPSGGQATPGGGAPGSCQTSGLKVAPATAKVQGGTHTQMFTATNTTGSACWMNGYPSLAPYRRQAGGGGGSSVQALLEPIPAQAGPLGAPAQQVTVQSKQAAVFFLVWSVGGGSCQQADGVSFDTPVSSSLAPVDFPFRYCGSSIKQSVVLPMGTTA